MMKVEDLAARLRSFPAWRLEVHGRFSSDLVSLTAGFCSQGLGPSGAMDVEVNIEGRDEDEAATRAFVLLGLGLEPVLVVNPADVPPWVDPGEVQAKGPRLPAGSATRLDLSAAKVAPAEITADPEKVVIMTGPASAAVPPEPVVERTLDAAMALTVLKADIMDLMRDLRSDGYGPAVNKVILAYKYDNRNTTDLTVISQVKGDLEFIRDYGDAPAPGPRQPEPASRPKIGRVWKAVKAAGYPVSDVAHSFVSVMLGRKVDSFNDLTGEEADRICDNLGFDEGGRWQPSAMKVQAWVRKYKGVLETGVGGIPDPVELPDDKTPRWKDPATAETVRQPNGVLSGAKLVEKIVDAPTADEAFDQLESITEDDVESLVDQIKAKQRPKAQKPDIVVTDEKIDMILGLDDGSPIDSQSARMLSEAMHGCGLDTHGHPSQSIQCLRWIGMVEDWDRKDSFMDPLMTMAQAEVARLRLGVYQGDNGHTKYDSQRRGELVAAFRVMLAQPK